MRLIHRPQLDPYFNIAAEEYVLKHLHDEAFMLWQNQRSVIVGRHQNTLSEIQHDFVEQAQIPVIRRLSGGGAVFHDLGNICFTFVIHRQRDNRPDFRFFSEPILSVLSDLGVSAHCSGRNDICIDNQKISGMAEALWHDRVLHHGTLLFDAHMDDLSEALKPDPLKLAEKGVASVRSRVTNISWHLPKPMRVEAFIQAIEAKIRNCFPEIVPSEFSSEEIQAIQTLSDSRYRSKAWNYGQVPPHNVHRRLRVPTVGTLEAYMVIQDGRIEHCRFFGDYFGQEDSRGIEARLSGLNYERKTLDLTLMNLDLNACFRGCSKEDLLKLLID